MTLFLSSHTKAVLACLAVVASHTTDLLAQSPGGTLSGSVIDQANKSIEGATATAKLEGGMISGTAATDAQGHSSFKGLAAGNQLGRRPRPRHCSHGNDTLRTEPERQAQLTPRPEHLDHPHRRIRSKEIGLQGTAS